MTAFWNKNAMSLGRSLMVNFDFSLKNKYVPNVYLLFQHSQFFTHLCKRFDGFIKMMLFMSR